MHVGFALGLVLNVAGAGSGDGSNGLTRRELLKKGSMAGVGVAWIAPAMTSIEMTADFAQATSGPPETSPTTQPTQQTSTTAETTTTESQTTTAAESTSTPPTQETTTTVGEQSKSTESSSTTAGQSSTSPTVESQTTFASSPPQSQEPEVEVEDEVLVNELPFTGLHLEQLIPLAGGAIATGAAVVRAAREKKQAEEGADTD